MELLKSGHYLEGEPALGLVILHGGDFFGSEYELEVKKSRIVGRGVRKVG